MRVKFDRLLVDSGTLYVTKYNKTGSLVKNGSGTAVASRLRDIEQIQDSPSNPFIDTTSLLWLAAGTSVEKEYIYVHSDGREYRITEITHARHGRDTTEKFVKCRIERFVE